MDRKHFLQQAGLASLGLVLVGPACTTTPKETPPPQKPDELTFGHGTHRYRVNKNWSQADQTRFPIKDAHEMVQAKDGRLFLITNETKNNILIFDKSGKLLDSWGDSFPGGHGLTIHDEGGTEFLYITDHVTNKVFKTTLDGRILLTIEAPMDSGKYESLTAFQPTETTIGPDGSIYVADGYGSQWISVYNQDGSLKNIFGGPEHFNNAHGICLDTRSGTPSLLITARAQNILKQFSLDGTWQKDIPLLGAHINRPVIHGENVYLSVLKSSATYDRSSGFVLILDKNNQLISCVGGSDPKAYLNGGLQLHQTVEIFEHPHDVCVDNDENLYIPQWNSGGVYPIMLERV